jgi:hypothetical protein
VSTIKQPVVDCKHRDGGTVLRLACRHEIFVAGVKIYPAEFECNQSPCYKPERELSTPEGFY